jgi:uncharacterized protein (TIGR03435 family)
MCRALPAAACLTVLAFGLSLAHSATIPPVFDAVSVKPAKGGGMGGRGIRETVGRLTAQNATVRRLIAYAYSLEDYQISGGPAWMNSAFFDMAATAAGPVSREEMRLMLQSLLACRFHLTIHRETREMPIFALVAGETPLKFRERAAGEEDPSVRSEPGKLRFKDVPALASFMSGFVERPVVDSTGLKGEFDISLDLPRPTASNGPGDGDGGSPDIAAAMAEFSQNLIQTVQQQLGLKAEARKGPIGIVVVDHAEKPAGDSKLNPSHRDSNGRRSHGRQQAPEIPFPSLR